MGSYPVLNCMHLQHSESASRMTACKYSELVLFATGMII